jgi:hypothetical protein
MNRQQFPRRLRLGVALAVLASAAVTLTGCNYLLLAGYLLGGPPSIEPEFDKETGLSMTDKDVTVAVVCTAPPDVKLTYSHIDHDVAKLVASRLFLKKIQVVNPDKVNDWLDRHPDWDTPEELGATFGVKYVIYVELQDFGLHEKHSAELYRGRADVLVSVWAMEGDEGEQIFSRDVESIFPRAVPRSTYETKYTTFKREYLEVLSDDIGKLFYETYHGDDIPNAN